MAITKRLGFLSNIKNWLAGTTPKRFGWLPSTPGPGQIFARPTGVVPPAQIDLRLTHSQVLDQGTLQTSTAHAFSTAYQFCLKKQKKAVFLPSRMFLYYNSRDSDHTRSLDSGSSIRQTVEVGTRLGVCSESSWNYNLRSFTVRPAQKSYDEAAKHRVVSSQRVRQDLLNLKTCLMSGLPFVFGFTVYNSFMADSVAQTGSMTMPVSMDYVIGAQTCTAVGYNDATQTFIVQNSWGTEWGDKGYFYMQYSYITHPNLAADFWQVTEVTL